MTMKEMIFKRKSCRSFTGKPVDAEMIEKILSFDLKPLYPEIKVRMDIVGRDRVKCICPWTTPQLITVYSEEAEGYLENIGFLFQQMDLYLQTLGLGVCWLGLGRMNPRTTAEVDGMKFVIMLAFGHPKGEQLRHDGKDFKRKAMNELSDLPDPRLEPLRLAPSATNSQPWFVTHEDGVLRIWREQLGMIKQRTLGKMNKIDMGIGLCHLYVTHQETFRFWREEEPPTLDGQIYVGSVTL